MIVPFLNQPLTDVRADVDVLYLNRDYTSDPGLVLQLTVDLIELEGGKYVL